MFPTEVLSIRAFRNLWLGQAISQFGDAFYYVVFMFMIAKITGEAKMVGFAGAAETLPFLLFSPYAGVVADRLDRRRIMLLSDVLSGLILAVFAAFVLTNAHPPAWTLLVTAFLCSCVRVFFIPAKNASIPALVPQDMLLKANAFSSMTQSFMPMIGLAMSASVLGVLYTLSTTWFFGSAIVVNALSFWGSAFFIAMLPPVIPDRKDEVKHPMTEFIEGLRYLKKKKVIATQIAVQCMLNLAISPFFVVYVITNDQWFGGKPQTLTWCEFTFFLGLIAGSMVVGKFKLVRPGVCFIVATAIIGVAIAVMGVSHAFWLYAALNVVCGLAVPFGEVPVNTNMQLSIEDAFRGRVNSVMWMLRAGIMPVGMALGGVFVKSVGLLGAYLSMGAGLVLAAVIGLASAEFRHSRLPEHQEKAAVPEPPSSSDPAVAASVA